jgi:hypothetical protein
MTSPLLVLNHKLILAMECYDAASNGQDFNSPHVVSLAQAVDYSNTLFLSNLTEWEHFFQLIKHCESKWKADRTATGWKEALEITRLQFERYREEFVAQHIQGETSPQQTQEAVPFDIAEANKRAAALATELSALLKQIAAHS